MKNKNGWQKVHNKKINGFPSDFLSLNNKK